MDFRLLLAPMAELSHRPLRELIESFGKPDKGPLGVSEYYTEMISAGALISGGPYESWYVDGGPCPEKIVYQLVGGNADQLIRAASVLDKRDCLGIDINMGCSAPAIARTGAGVRWMADTEKAASLIAGIRKNVKRRLSVKLRTGLADDFDYLVNFCRRLEEEGVDFITLHPRTAKEKFKGRCRWEYVSRLNDALKIPVCGNGDIVSAEEILAKAAVCGAVMTGRAAVRRPWIFAQARALENGRPFTVPDIEETGLLFLELLDKYQPPEFFPSRARRFFGFFCDNLQWGTYLKNLLNRETSRAGMETVWKRFFKEQGA